ncbi:MAG TPA: hypothetical protein VNC41_19140 [Acidimicrobiia bacterium]|jgi:hypothetical protein|nr:hypothetical protein [Acidimicrobiia bacterium]
MFVCTRCEREVPNSYEQFSERLEYRRMDCKTRPVSFTTRLVCIECVSALGALHDRGGLHVAVTEEDRPTITQGGLFT